jgi:hypothetical protein
MPQLAATNLNFSQQEAQIRNKGEKLPEEWWAGLHDLTGELGVSL